MIYLDVQDILTTYIEGLLNDAITEVELDEEFHLGYYNMTTPNKFEFETRVGAKYTDTKFIPSMLENWGGEWEPLDGIEYIELSINITTMIQINADYAKKVLALNIFSKSIIGRFDKITLTDTETDETEDVYIKFGGGVPRPMGSSLIWGGRRYLRFMMPIDITFGNKMFLGDSVTNTLNGVLLPPTFRRYFREMETYPITLLSSVSGGNSTKTKKNINKENAWTSTLSFPWNDSTNFIVEYLCDPMFDQSTTFTHVMTLLGTKVYTRTVNIISSSFDPTIGKGAIVTITIMEVYSG